jgi:endonuclease/exonuclease/phosphatase family metal-dependent hydrolase
MRIVTYNIHSGVGVDKVQNYRRIGLFLASQGIDIALIQEMDTRPTERRTERDIDDLCAEHFTDLAESAAIQESNGWYGNAILSRFPVLSKKTLDVSQKDVQPRNIQEVVLDTDIGPLRIINTHKGLKKNERRKQFALLDEYLREKLQVSTIPIIVGGDFNEWQFFTQAFKRINEVLTQQTVSATFPTAFPLFRLDRMWTTFSPANVKTSVLKTPETRWYSDHYPILLEVNI